MLIVVVWPPVQQFFEKVNSEKMQFNTLMRLISSTAGGPGNSVFRVQPVGWSNQITDKYPRGKYLMYSLLLLIK